MATGASDVFATKRVFSLLHNWLSIQATLGILQHDSRNVWYVFKSNRLRDATTHCHEVDRECAVRPSAIQVGPMDLEGVSRTARTRKSTE